MTQSKTCGRLTKLPISCRIAQSLILGALPLAVACAGSGQYLRADQAPDVFYRPKPSLTIEAGDLVGIRVFGQEPLTVHEHVRSDGKVTMPLIGEVEIAGKNPSAVAKEIESRLAPFVVQPNVVVVVEESRIRVVAIGELKHNGPLVLEAGDNGLLPALASAGGLTEFASKSDIYVIRTDGALRYRIRFEYDDIVRGVGKAAEFKLRTGDAIVAE